MRALSGILYAIVPAENLRANAHMKDRQREKESTYSGMEE
jgi:hypothetical protein